MGLFSLFNKKEEAKITVELKRHLIDGVLFISLPIEWIPYESDRFRAKTRDGKLQMSIVNYESANTIRIDNHFFEDLKLETYEKFVIKGLYEPYDDLKVSNTFISKSFKVDEEIQYYYTTANNINNQQIITDIIIRVIGDYDKQMKALIEAIGQSITAS